MMKTTVFVVALFGLRQAVPGAAQQGQQPPPTVAAYLRNAYTGNKTNIQRSMKSIVPPSSEPRPQQAPPQR